MQCQGKFSIEDPGNVRKFTLHPFPEARGVHTPVLGQKLVKREDSITLRNKGALQKVRKLQINIPPGRIRGGVFNFANPVPEGSLDGRI
jgi:hypothetical protein